ncbi:hypothetical protein GINT2_000663 [Glugoides intestinalis]
MEKNPEKNVIKEEKKVLESKTPEIFEEDITKERKSVKTPTLEAQDEVAEIDADKKEKEKKNIIKPPFAIKLLNLLHYIFVSSLIFIAIHYFIEYTNYKDNEFLINETATCIRRMFVCVIGAIFFAFTRAMLMSPFDECSEIKTNQ